MSPSGYDSSNAHSLGDRPGIVIARPMKTGSMLAACAVMLAKK